MSKIIIGTTPTITYTFNEVSVSDIVTAILTIKTGKTGTIIVEKHLEDAAIGESSLSWTLTQSETLLLGTNTATMMLNWKLNDGTRGASEKTKVLGADNHKREVI